jgi:SAM-dependent methyltransferase
MVSQIAPSGRPKAASGLLGRVKRRVGRAVRDLSRIPVGAVRWGDLRNLQPICPQFGFSRGKPVDRHYVEAFLADHAGDVSGHVLEIKDAGYTRQFGGSRLVRSDVLDINPDNRDATIVADLNDPAALKGETFDCVIFTQTLQFFLEPARALRHLHGSLKPGGVLLMTVPGITPVRSRDAWYWSFTEATVKSLLGELFAPADTVVCSYGNLVTATAFLQGLCAAELSQRELAASDPAYPLLIGARAVKA